MLQPVQAERIRRRLELLYSHRAEECFCQLVALLERYRGRIPPQRKPAWDQRDIVLITYGDQVQCDREKPLACLKRFLAQVGLDRWISTIHILPFFPYSSDDGFSVVDYRRVDPELGDWSHVAALRQQYELMFDLVLNHVSRRSGWFQHYLEGREPYTRYFIEVDPSNDLSQVTRPRSLPLLTEVETAGGRRWVWTTFSDDQIDLNYAEPAVLLEMLDVLLFYLEHGARIVRLDAIAYLWKRIGTACIHLPETHEVVRLMRDVVEAAAPGAVLLTETNVPHEENVSYFGDGDEAQMVYNFSLAPLLLEALLSGDATILGRWLVAAGGTPPGTTVLNFTASHDGIGVRPLEGIMPEARRRALYDAVLRRGGRISARRNPDGSQSPYELNITYFSALSDPEDPSPARHVRRFLASQALMLSLRGIPGVYFHSLVGTPNWLEGLDRTGRARSINRRKFRLDELTGLLGDPRGTWHRVLAGYKRLLAVRTTQPAFHPEAPQEVIELGNPAVVSLLRTSVDGQQRVAVLVNVSSTVQKVDLAGAVDGRVVKNLLAQQNDSLRVSRPPGIYELQPYESAWLLLDR